MCEVKHIYGFVQIRQQLFCQSTASSTNIQCYTGKFPRFWGETIVLLHKELNCTGTALCHTHLFFFSCIAAVFELYILLICFLLGIDLTDACLFAVLLRVCIPIRNELF